MGEVAICGRGSGSWGRKWFMGEVTGFLGPLGSQSPARFVVLLAQGESGTTQLFYFFYPDTC